MRKFALKTLLVLCIGLLSVLSFAQGDGESTFEFEDSGASITFPDDWEQSVGEDGGLELVLGGTTVLADDETVIASLIDVDEADSLETLVELFVGELAISEDEDTEFGAIKLVELGEREVARMPFEIDGASGAFIALPMDDDSVGMVMFLIPTDDVEELSPVVDEIIASFNVSDGSGSTATGEACTVSTTESNTVQIRVGPGSNRTVIAFLPTGLDFGVLGQTTDDDDNVWFSVPKDDVAPTKAVNETWVAADSVDQSGDCANVVDALAPPIIPIRTAPPTPVPQVDDDGTVTETVVDTPADTPDEATGDDFAVDADGAYIPTQGTWLEVHGNGSWRCGDSISGVASPTTGDFTATLSGGGANGIVFDGNFFTYIGNNTYENYYTEETSNGTYVARTTFTLTSANTGSGSIGEVIGPCSGFLPITVNFVG